MEEEYSRWNFDVADTKILFQHYEDAEKECKAIQANKEIDA